MQPIRPTQLLLYALLAVPCLAQQAGYAANQQAKEALQAAFEKGGNLYYGAAIEYNEAVEELATLLGKPYGEWDVDAIRKNNLRLAESLRGLARTANQANLTECLDVAEESTSRLRTARNANKAELEQALEERAAFMSKHSEDVLDEIEQSTLNRIENTIENVNKRIDAFNLGLNAIDENWKEAVLDRNTTVQQSADIYSNVAVMYAQTAETLGVVKEVQELIDAFEDPRLHTSCSRILKQGKEDCARELDFVDRVLSGQKLD